MVLRWIVLTLAVLALGGCGGDDDAEPETTPEAGEATEQQQERDAAAEEEAEVTEDEFIRRADRICRKANDRVRELPPRSDAQFEVVAEGLEELRALEVPDGLERQWRQYLTAVELQTEADRRGDIEEAEHHRSRKSQVALNIGFAVCGSG